MKKFVKPKTNLVLIHGWGMNSRVWSRVLPLLQSAFEVQTLDLPGHGRRLYQAGGADLEAWADVLLKEVRAPAIWMGWNLGGMVALEVARRTPENVRALVLAASTPKFTQAPDWLHAVEPDLLYKFETELPSDYHKVLEDFIVLQSMGGLRLREEVRRLRACLQEGGEPAPEALALGLKFLLQVDLRAALSRLEQPCLLLLGERDKLVPSALAEVFHRDYPRVEVQVIKGSGHAPFLSHAAEFSDALSAWAKRTIKEFASL